MNGDTQKKNIIDITNINEKVYELIKKQIISLEYPPGYQLNVRKIQEELGVSNSPIKDALFRLSGEGMVEITSRRGTFVRDISERDVYEIEEARILLETGAVELITDKITDDQLMELEKLYQETLFNDDQFDYEVFMEKDNLFHLKMVEFTQNEHLLDMYRKLNPHMQIVRFQFLMGQSKPLQWTNQDHLNILTALKARDTAKAKGFVKDHLLKAREAFLQHRKGMKAFSVSE